MNVPATMLLLGQPKVFHFEYHRYFLKFLTTSIMARRELFLK